MSEVFLHPELRNYFVEIDHRNAAEATKVVDLYERANAILLPHLCVDFDVGFFDSIVVPTDPEFKKFKSIRFLRDWNQDRRELATRVREKCFGGDSGRLDYFAQQVAAVNAQVTALAENLFPHYRYINHSTTWRLTETVNENLHVDVYNKDVVDHHLRLFVNLDSRPRIWHTSYDLEYLLEKKLRLLDSEFLKRATPGRICHALNFAVFKGFEEAGREGCPKHIAFFGPGAVWLVDSRKISHQVFYGRMALSTEYAVDKSSMNDPSLHYLDIVDRYVRRGGT